MFNPLKLKLLTVIPSAKICSKKRVIKPTSQEKRFKVIRFMGNKRIFIMGFIILFRKYQIIEAVMRVLKLRSTIRPGKLNPRK